jgi:hypothetical protein
MVWSVWDALDDYTFVTSDNPVTIFNPCMQPSEVAGIGLAGSILLFPSTSTHCLELSHAEKLSDPTLDPLTPLDVESFDVEGVHIRAGRKMPADGAYITNCLQGLHAERYLAGNNIGILQEVYEFLKTGKPRSNKAIESDEQ